MTDHTTSTKPTTPPHWQPRRRIWLRRTLRLSQQEAVASSTTTATGDNFFNAFAIHLGANAAQMGWLTAFPQFFGTLMELLSAWLGGYLPRRPQVLQVIYRVARLNPISGVVLDWLTVTSKRDGDR